MRKTRISNLCLAISLLIGSAAAAEAQVGDASRGKVLFQQRCGICHSVAPKASGVGPNLAGVVGRKSAATPFNYSPAMKKAGLVWNIATLDSFLAAPMKMVPGARMAIATPVAADRKNIIAYLASTK